MIFQRFFILATICFLAIAGDGHAEEQINQFDVAIDVQKNGDVIITETIDVTVEGRRIRRGIFRDLPRYYQRDGATLPYQYKVSGVTRNGVRERYDMETEGNARRIRIGDADRLLDHGDHVYEIRYRVKNQTRYFETYDEIYWNATGSFWTFPIQSARATVTLPPGANVTQIAAYTGAQGDSGRNYRHRTDGDAQIFETTRPLKRREGMTIAVGFSKGAVDPPSTADKQGYWWQKNGALAVMIGSLLGVFGYYWNSFNRVGRDPQKGPVIARYGPPEGYSPAAVHRIYYREMKGHKALIATLMNLAVNGRLEIDASKKKQTRLSWKGETRDDAALTSPEQTLESRLFMGATEKTLGKKYDSDFTKAYKHFRSTISKRYGKPYFQWNFGYTLVALAISAAALIFALTQSYAWSQWHTIAVLGIAALNGLFMYLMPAPTEKGQKIRTEIEGFKLYLETAEKLQLNAVKIGDDAPPPMTVERYERFLPYAVALDVEKPWTKHFERLIPEEAEHYAPHWMHGHYGSNSMSAINRSLVSNMTSGVVGAMPQSSSSSGSGGGGFSGGGGGGGGGGGW